MALRARWLVYRARAAALGTLALKAVPPVQFTQHLFYADLFAQLCEVDAVGGGRRFRAAGTLPARRRGMLEGAGVTACLRDSSFAALGGLLLPRAGRGSPRFPPDAEQTVDRSSRRRRPDATVSACSAPRPRRRACPEPVAERTRSRMTGLWTMAVFAAFHKHRRTRSFPLRLMNMVPGGTGRPRLSTPEVFSSGKIPK